MTKFEIAVAQPLSVVKERLENSRKEMAPKIGTCKLLPAANTLVCSVFYGNAYATIDAKESENGKGTVATVEILGLKLWRNAIVVVCLVIFIQLLSHYGYIWRMHPPQWIGLAVIIASWTILSLAMNVISKNVLRKYVTETLTGDG